MAAENTNVPVSEMHNKIPVAALQGLDAHGDKLAGLAKTLRGFDTKAHPEWERAANSLDLVSYTLRGLEHAGTDNLSTDENVRVHVRHLNRTAARLRRECAAILDVDGAFTGYTEPTATVQGELLIGIRDYLDTEIQPMLIAMNEIARPETAGLRNGLDKMAAFLLSEFGPTLARCSQELRAAGDAVQDDRYKAVAELVDTMKIDFQELVWDALENSKSHTSIIRKRISDLSDCANDISSNCLEILSLVLEAQMEGRPVELSPQEDIARIVDQFVTDYLMTPLIEMRQSLIQPASVKSKAR